MKKSILSLTIAGLMAAGSAQAVTVYETEDSYVKLTGEVAFEFIRDGIDGEEIDSKTDNVDLEVTAGYKLENGVEVYGFYAFEFATWSEEQNDTDDSKTNDPLKDHYLGIKKDGWEVRYGDMDYAIDEFSVRVNLDAKTASERVLNPDDSEKGGSREVLYAKYKTDGFYVSSSYDLDLDDDGTDSMTGYDIFAEGEIVDGVWVGGTYSLQDYFDSGDYVSYGVQAEYKGIKNLTLGAAWFFGENYRQKESGDDVNNDATGWDLAAKYKINKKITVAGGYGVASPDSDNEVVTNDLTTWYVTANYNFRKNFDTYVEVYDEEQGTDSGKDDQLGFVVGLSLDF